MEGNQVEGRKEEGIKGERSPKKQEKEEEKKRKRKEEKEQEGKRVKF